MSYKESWKCIEEGRNGSLCVLSFYHWFFSGCGKWNLVLVLGMGMAMWRKKGMWCICNWVETIEIIFFVSKSHCNNWNSFATGCIIFSFKTFIKWFHWLVHEFIPLFCLFFFIICWNWENKFQFLLKFFFGKFKILYQNQQKMKFIKTKQRHSLLTENQVTH